MVAARKTGMVMSANDINEKGVRAVIQLCKDPNAEVPCPVCEQDNLRFKDIPFPDGSGKERIFFCPSCGAKSYMRMVDGLD